MAHFDAPAHRAAARVRAIDKAPPPAAQTTGLLQCKPDLEVCRCRAALPDAVHSLCSPQSCSAHMSAKRRKVDAPGTQGECFVSANAHTLTTAVSALSALAARRLASAEPSPSPATPPSNPFSPLLQRREATASPKRLARTPNQGQDARYVACQPIRRALMLTDPAPSPRPLRRTRRFVSQRATTGYARG